MNRRSFFSRVLGGLAAAVTAPFLPKLPPHTLGSVGAAPTVNGVPTTVIDREVGISIRFIKQWDMNTTNKF